MDPILSVENLRTSFFTPRGEIRAVDGLSFDVGRGEILGVVGESGSGKSATLLSLMGLLGPNGRVVDGQALFDGQDLLALTGRQLSDLRGRRLSMIFQDPMTSLNPVLTVGFQLEEPLKRHGWPGGRRSRRERVLEMLRRVGLTPPKTRFHQYPHELSGGQRQRAMIAMAMICEPALLLADEPTTALDVTVQAQILELMRGLQQDAGASVVLVTHDLGVVASLADRVLVLYGARVMERGTRREVLGQPAHPYTRGLLRSLPNPAQIKERLVPIEGQPPDLLRPPLGCPYAPRCPEVMSVCRQTPPPTVDLSETQAAACWLYDRGSAASLSEGFSVK